MINHSSMIKQEVFRDMVCTEDNCCVFLINSSATINCTYCPPRVWPNPLQEIVHGYVVLCKYDH